MLVASLSTSCSDTGRPLLFHQAATLLQACYVQAISDLLRQLVTSPMKLSTLLQDAILFQICQAPGNEPDNQYDVGSMDRLVDKFATTCAFFPLFACVVSQTCSQI